MLGTLRRAMGSESLCDMDDSGCLYPSYLHHHSVPSNGNLLELQLQLIQLAPDLKIPPDFYIQILYNTVRR